MSHFQEPLIQRPLTFVYDRTPNLPIDLAGLPAGPNDWVMGMIGRVLKVAAEEVGLEVLLKREGQQEPPDPLTAQ